MQVTFNPKDTNTFASASLDRTVKVWSIGQPTPNFTLEGHEKGVNAVDYFTGGEAKLFVRNLDNDAGYSLPALFSCGRYCLRQVCTFCSAELFKPFLCRG